MTPTRDAATASRHETIYSTPSDLELVITRVFDARRTLVWAAFTDAKHLPNWHTGPEGTTMPVCEIDLRPGGTWRHVWRNAEGREFEATGTYCEVDPPERIVQLSSSRSGEGQTSTTTFAEDNGRTIVTVTMRFASTAARDRAVPLARFGTESNYAHLDAYLASRS